MAVALQRSRFPASLYSPVPFPVPAPRDRCRDSCLDAFTVAGWKRVVDRSIGGEREEFDVTTCDCVRLLQICGTSEWLGVTENEEEHTPPSFLRKQGPPRERDALIETAVAPQLHAGV